MHHNVAPTHPSIVLQVWAQMEEDLGFFQRAAELRSYNMQARGEGGLGLWGLVLRGAGCCGAPVAAGALQGCQSRQNPNRQINNRIHHF